MIHKDAFQFVCKIETWNKFSKILLHYLLELTSRKEKINKLIIFNFQNVSDISNLKFLGAQML